MGTRLKQEEKIYTQFLPVLKLIEKKYEEYRLKLAKNSVLLTDKNNPYKIINWVKPKEIIIKYKSLAGVTIPILKDIIFHDYFINFFDVPYWFTYMIDNLKDVIKQSIQSQIINKQYI